MHNRPPFEIARLFIPVMDALPFALVVLDELGHVLWTNQSSQLTGERDGRSHLESRVGDGYFGSVENLLSLDRQEIDAVRQGIKTLFAGERKYREFDFTSRHGDGDRRAFVRAVLLENVEPSMVLIIRQEADDLDFVEPPPELWRDAFAAVDEPFFIADGGGRIQYANAAYSRLTGNSSAETIGQSIWATAGALRDPALEDAAWNALRAGKSWQEELSIQRSDGETRWVLRTITPLHDEAGRLNRLVAVGHDVTGHHTLVDELRRRAYYDGLTGLPNRTLFLDRLTHAHTRARRSNQPLAVMFLDLNGFKTVNDHFGHQIGDVVLAEVARRLVVCLRASDTVARSGGDEFTFLLEDVASDSDALAVARRIIEEISHPLEIEGTRFSIAGGIGIAFNSPAITDPEVLLRQADIALYHAKARGNRQFVIYRDDMTMPASGAA